MVKARLHSAAGLQLSVATAEAVCLLFSDILESGTVVILFLHGLVPHGGGSYPQPVFAVKRPVDNHGFHGLRMGSDADDLVEITFEMPVFSGFDIH